MSNEIKHISGAAGGYLVGNSHDNGGIQAINKAIGKPLEMEGGEVVITKPAVEDTELREFEGKMLTNRQILSKINESGGGISFAEKGAKLPTKIEFCGTEYKYGGETLTDYEIAHRISKCGCSHEEDSYADGGNLEKDLKDNAINVAVNATETLPLMEKGGLINENNIQIIANNFLEYTDNSNYKGIYNDEEEIENGITLEWGKYGYSVSESQQNDDYEMLKTASAKFNEKNIGKLYSIAEESDKYNIVKIVDYDILANDENLVFSLSEKYFNKLKEGRTNSSNVVKRLAANSKKSKDVEMANVLAKKLDISEKEAIEIIKSLQYAKEYYDKNKNQKNSRFDTFGLRSFPRNDFQNLEETFNYIQTDEFINKIYSSANPISEGSVHLYDWAVLRIKYNEDSRPYKADGSTDWNNRGRTLDIYPYVAANITSKEDFMKFFKKAISDFIVAYNYYVIGPKTEPIEQSIKDSDNQKSFKENSKKDLVQLKEIKPFIKKESESPITFSTIVDDWDDVPSEWKNTTKVKKVAFINSPYDKGLISIVKPFLGEDEVRLILQGINFDKKGITATNAHTLIHLPYPNPEFIGTYNPGIGKIKKQETIFGNYPNYEAVLPISEDCEHYKISIYKLLQYAKVAENYANKITHQAVFKVNDQYFGLNCSFLIDCLQALLKLGIEETYFFFQSVGRASMFCTKLDYKVGKDILVLMMPTIVKDFKYGAFDVDYNRELLCYYDFSTNEIYNENGSVAEFKMSYQNNSFFDTQETKLLKSVIGRNNVLPILNYFVVENNVARVTDLETDLVIKNIDSKDGIYQITDNVPEITMYDIEEYPQPRSETNADAIQFTINSEAFEYYLDKIKLGLGKDQFRPAMEGIFFHFKENKLFLVTTDHHILFRVNITKFIPSENLQDIERKIIVKPSILFNLLDEIENETLKITIDAVNFKLESSKFILTTKNIDAKAPNYEGILPPYFNVKKEINLSSLRTCLNSEKVIDIVKNNKKETVAIYNDNNDLYVGLYKNKNIENSSQICNIEIVKKEVTFQLLDQDIVVIMPLQPTTLILNSEIAYSEAILKKVVDVVNSEEIELYSDSNSNVKSNVVLMTSFDFDKTISSPKENEIDFINLQNNFKIKVEKVYYTDKSSTYGASLFYNDSLFKYFAIISNTTKESAVSNVYDYLKTLEIKNNKIQENAPNKGNFSVYYYDKSGEHRFISDSKKSIENFIENVNNLKKPTASTSENEQLQDTIDGLEILLETAKGKNKANIIDTIEGLKLLLETPEFAKGGETQVLLAPNGKPSNLNATQWYLVRTPEFKKWFGDWENSPNTSSKVVDENGEPLVVYHGTKSDFFVFDLSKAGVTDSGLLGKAFYFTPSKQQADFFSKSEQYGHKGSSKTLECFLNLKNPVLIQDSIFPDGKTLRDIHPNGITPKSSTAINKKLKSKKYDGSIFVLEDEILQLVAFESNQIKLADGTNTTFDENTNDIRYEKGGLLDNSEKKELYQEWNDLVNMTSSELQNYYDSKEGKTSGLSAWQAKELGIKSGRESAKWIIKMKEIPMNEWTEEMWEWAKRQISFIKRMSGVEGDLYDENHEKTKKHKALLIWGHNPEKLAKGGTIDKKEELVFTPIATPIN